VVKHVRHHITPLGFCLPPGRRASPSKPHALPAPANVVSTPMDQTPSPFHGPSRIPLVLGGWCPRRWDSTENDSEPGASPAPQPVLAPALGSLGASTRDPRHDHSTDTSESRAYSSCCAVDPSCCLHTQPHIAQPKRSCASPGLSDLARAPGNKILG